MITVVKLSVADKVLRKLPNHIAAKLRTWVAAIETEGLEEVRKVPGYHDEPLRGDRDGQRSIKLNDAYRAIYKIEKDAVSVEFVDVIEAHKHKY